MSASSPPPFVNSPPVDDTDDDDEPSTKKARKEDLPSFQAQTYEPLRLLGKGTFGHVYLCTNTETGEAVAIKSMLNPPEKDREVHVLKELKGHPNIVLLKGAFRSDVGTKEETLNLVFEFLSDTLHRVIKHTYNILQKQMEPLYIKMYQYQIMRGLNRMHTVGIAHCDLKPQNCLIDGKTHTLKICDLGTARRLIFCEHRPLYQCSRYYRAPEIIFGSQSWTCAIDLWSAGCILGELFLGQPLFTGSDGIDQAKEIIKVLGTPSNAELRAMNPNYPDTFEFNPRLEKLKWPEALRNKATEESAYELIDSLVTWDPRQRLPPAHCMAHRFFEFLRAWDNSFVKVDLFNWEQDELMFCTEEMQEKLTPAWYLAKRMKEEDLKVEKRMKEEDLKVETPGSSTSAAAASSP